MNEDESNSKVVENLILMKMVHQKGEKIKVIKGDISLNSKQNFLLATHYLKLKQNDKSFQHFLISGEQGYSSGYIECGKLLENKKVKISKETPRHFYEKSIEKGNVNGYCRIGKLDNDLGFIKRGAKLNDGESLFELSKHENKLENLTKSKELKYENAIVYLSLNDILNGDIKYGMNELKLYSKDFILKLEKILKLIELFQFKNNLKKDKYLENQGEGSYEESEGDEGGNSEESEEDESDQENEKEDEQEKEEKGEKHEEVEVEQEEEEESTDFSDSSDSTEDNSSSTQDSDSEDDESDYSESSESEDEKEEINFKQDFKISLNVLPSYNIEETFLNSFKQYDLHDIYDAFKDFILNLTYGEFNYLISLYYQDSKKMEYLSKSIYEDSEHKWSNLAKIDLNYELIKINKEMKYEIYDGDDKEMFYFNSIKHLKNKKELKELILEKYKNIDIKNKDLLIYVSFSEYVLYNLEIDDTELSGAILKNSMFHGNIHSTFLYGCKLLKSKDFEGAFEKLNICVNNHHPGAHFLMAMLFKDGQYHLNQHPIEIYFFLKFFEENITKDSKIIIIDIFKALEDSDWMKNLTINLVIISKDSSVIDKYIMKDQSFQEWIQKERRPNFYSFNEGFRDFILGYILNDLSYFEKSGLISYHPFSRKMIGLSHDCHLPIGDYREIHLDMNLLDPKLSFVKNKINPLNLDEKFYDYLSNLQFGNLQFYSYDVKKEPFQLKHEYYLYQLKIDKNLKSKL